MKIRFGSICSGIEAASVAWRPLGWHCEFVCEIEPFPCAVLKHHYPTTPNYGDITKFKEWPTHELDVLIGGTPCQSFSLAGLRKGMADPRGNLALIFLGIVDKYRPTYVVWENVPGVHSSWTDVADGKTSEECGAAATDIRRLGVQLGIDEIADIRIDQVEEVAQTNDFDCFLSGLEKLGYGFATTILDAQFFGLAQRRKRVFVVGHSGGQWQRAAAVLFDSTCVSWNSPPSRQAWQKPAGPISARTKGGGGPGTDFDLDGGVIARPSAREKIGQDMEIGFDASGTIGGANGGGSSGAYSECSGRNGRAYMGDKVDAINAQSGCGDTSPCVAIPINMQAAGKNGVRPPNGCGVGKDGDPAPTLGASDRHAVFTLDVATPLMSGGDTDGSHGARSGDRKDDNLVAYALRAEGFDASEDGTSRGTPILPVVMAHSHTNAERVVDGSPTLTCHHEVPIAFVPQEVLRMQVRRLLPIECSRLNGFPDKYLDIEFNGKPACDGPKYRAIGNSMAVPCIRWIGQRIEQVMKCKD